MFFREEGKDHRIVKERAECGQRPFGRILKELKEITTIIIIGYLLCHLIIFILVLYFEFIDTCLSKKDTAPELQLISVSVHFNTMFYKCTQIGLQLI